MLGDKVKGLHYFWGIVMYYLVLILAFYCSRASLVSQLVQNPSAMQCWRPGFDPWVGKIPWRRERLPTPVFWPGGFHGQSMGSQKVRHNWVTFTFTFIATAPNQYKLNGLKQNKVFILRFSSSEVWCASYWVKIKVSIGLSLRFSSGSWLLKFYVSSFFDCEKLDTFI